MDSSSKQLIKAVGLAPLAALLVLLLYVTVYSAARSSYDNILSDWLFLSFFAVPIAYAATLLIGLPTHLILSKLDRANVANYVIVGVVMALLPFVGIALVDGISRISTHDLMGYPTMVVGCAAGVSWSFAKIALNSPKTRGFDEHRLPDQ